MERTSSEQHANVRFRSLALSHIFTTRGGARADAAGRIMGLFAPRLLRLDRSTLGELVLSRDTLIPLCICGGGNCRAGGGRVSVAGLRGGGEVLGVLNTYSRSDSDSVPKRSWYRGFFGMTQVFSDAFGPAAFLMRRLKGALGEPSLLLLLGAHGRSLPSRVLLCSCLLLLRRATLALAASHACFSSFIRTRLSQPPLLVPARPGGGGAVVAWLPCGRVVSGDRAT